MAIGGQSQYYISFTGQKHRVNSVCSTDTALAGDQQFLAGVLRQYKYREGN